MARMYNKQKEASARIKINKLLEAAGWRFFPNGALPANIRLEQNVTLKSKDIEDLGENFEKVKKGVVDFLLLDENNRPIIVLEAKSEDKNPLVGKEQARKYARSLKCRFIILSNGNIHYFWDLQFGNPNIITSFPKLESIKDHRKIEPNPQKLVDETVETDYVVLTQRPNYQSEAAWKNEAEHDGFIKENRLRFLRPYQLKAIHEIQKAVQTGKTRFLLEMATGTGKTLVAGALCKLFLRTGNARRILFLVDRIELEEQAKKVLKALLSNDYQTVIYKENRDDWVRAEIVVSTVQSLLFNNKYQTLFSPTDFDLVISDEAHRSIGGNSRAVFEYFVGYKLGLTATPKDYLKKFNNKDPNFTDPREYERRLLLDTYRTFGCENSQPTFRYSLLDGVKEEYLVNPTVVDARTEVTTQLLSEQGFVVEFKDEDGEDRKEVHKQKEFEKRFFSDATNQLFCKTFLENALRDPISREIGKSIIFAVSQNHAAKIAQILNQMAHRMFPGKYNSDFAVQVTSQIPDAQQFTVDFTNNKLHGSGNFMDSYKTSKARVCVTVGMMTTGYDCTDLLNLGLFRPIFSPTLFIQIKGRGTRKHNFLDQLFDEKLKESLKKTEKTTFKLFDFFATCEYFEEKYNYDQVIKLPKLKGAVEGGRDIGNITKKSTYEHLGEDILSSIVEETIGLDGMKIDRKFFESFEDTVKKDEFINQKIESGQWNQIIDYINNKIFDKPEEYYNLDKLRRAAAVDRHITLREILEKIFGFIPRFKTKDELLEEEFSKFIVDYKPEEIKAIPALKTFFKAYATSDSTRNIIESKQFTDLATNSAFSMEDLRAVPDKYRELIPEYIKVYVPLNQFTA